VSDQGSAPSDVLSRLGYGSVAEAVLRQAPCPVLTVKTPKFEAGPPTCVAAGCRRELIIEVRPMEVAISTSLMYDLRRLKELLQVGIGYAGRDRRSLESLEDELNGADIMDLTAVPRRTRPTVRTVLSNRFRSWRHWSWLTCVKGSTCLSDRSKDFWPSI
jgi:hypothetical protein